MRNPLPNSAGKTSTSSSNDFLDVEVVRRNHRAVHRRRFLLIEPQFLLIARSLKDLLLLKVVGKVVKFFIAACVTFREGYPHLLSLPHPTPGQEGTYPQ